MLEVSGLKKYYGSERVLNGVDLALERQGIRGFLGPNGAGKTTTFKVIAGAEGATAGAVHLDDLDLTALPINLRARKGLTFLPQERSLFRGLRVRENIEVYLRGRKFSGGRTSGGVHEVLKKLNIFHLKDKKGSELSSGQGRKVEIARALALEPCYLLLDEPFSDLDPRSVAEIKDILVSLKREEEMGIMISDHRAKEALSITDYNYLIKDGEIIAQGNSEEIVETEEAREAYFA